MGRTHLGFRESMFGEIADFLVGTWLSLVEHSLGVRGVGSSNLPVPTITPTRTRVKEILRCA